MRYQSTHRWLDHPSRWHLHSGPSRRLLHITPQRRVGLHATVPMCAGSVTGRRLENTDTWKDGGYGWNSYPVKGVCERKESFIRRLRQSKLWVVINSVWDSMAWAPWARAQVKELLIYLRVRLKQGFWRYWWPIRFILLPHCGAKWVQFYIISNLEYRRNKSSIFFYKLDGFVNVELFALVQMLHLRGYPIRPHIGIQKGKNVQRRLILSMWIQ